MIANYSFNRIYEIQTEEEKEAAEQDLFENPIFPEKEVVIYIDDDAYLEIRLWERAASFNMIVWDFDHNCFNTQWIEDTSRRVAEIVCREAEIDLSA